MKYKIGLLITLFVVNGCTGPKDASFESAAQTVNWSAAADSTSKALANHFWNAQQHYFNYSNAGNTDFHYWPQAHALEVMLDAYNRTNETFYKPFINQWYEGVKAKNGDTFFNQYYDDMEWNALAMLRAYTIAKDERFKTAAREVWDDIKTGWNENAGGGLMWIKSDPYGKNACSNGPAAILAARLYQLGQHADDLEWAKKIYDWEKNTLVGQSTGEVWDNISVKSGEPEIKKEWVFTYNQGTYIGAAIELYNITKESVYLNDAVKSADYTLDSLANSSDRLLKSEGTGDGGLFKGIFIRYFTELIMLPDLPYATRKRYGTFLKHNAETLWLEGTHKNQVLFSPYWKEKPGDEVDLTVELSGAMLMEAAARLEQENMLEPVE